MEFIQSHELPAPAGHYSQAVAAGGLVFLSGILPSSAEVDPARAGFEAQCGSVFEQCGKVLRAAGCGFADVVQCTAYIVGVEHWPAFNAAYARVFGAHKPARAVVPVPALHYGFLVEVQLVAQRPHGWQPGTQHPVAPAKAGTHTEAATSNVQHGSRLSPG